MWMVQLVIITMVTEFSFYCSPSLSLLEVIGTELLSHSLKVTQSQNGSLARIWTHFPSLFLSIFKLHVFTNGDRAGMYGGQWTTCLNLFLLQPYGSLSSNSGRDRLASKCLCPRSRLTGSQLDLFVCALCVRVHVCRSEINIVNPLKWD